ncbi:unnamed protein product [Ectocarpus sp. 4 AP-2014]
MNKERTVLAVNRRAGAAAGRRRVEKKKATAAAANEKRVRSTGAKCKSPPSAVALASKRTKAKATATATAAGRQADILNNQTIKGSPKRLQLNKKRLGRPNGTEGHRWQARHYS